MDFCIKTENQKALEWLDKLWNELEQKAQDNRELTRKYVDQAMEIGQLKNRKLRCGECGNVGMLSSHVVYADEIHKLRSAIEFALTYSPDTDGYKIKHTAWPKLKAALENTEDPIGLKPIYTLSELAQKSIGEKKNFKIMKTTESNMENALWFSGFQNLDGKVFTARDLSASWVIIMESQQTAASDERGTNGN